MAAMGSDSCAVVMTFTGDLLLDRGVRERIQSDGIDALFSPSVDSLFCNSDIVVSNLECPATHVKSPLNKWIVFRGDPEWLADLKRQHITHLSLANNHSIDQGREGLMDTVDEIAAAGIIPVGAGMNMNDASKPILLTEKPRKVWLLASLRLSLENFPYLPELPCVSQLEFSQLIQQIRLLKNEDPTCFVVVSLHWGGENTFHPLIQQVAEAHQIIDAGADIIIGHHPHTLQPAEQFKGKWIFYSIGNFIFDALKTFHSTACVVNIHLTKLHAEVKSIPVVIDHCTPVITK